MLRVFNVLLGLAAALLTFYMARKLKYSQPVLALFLLGEKEEALVVYRLATTWIEKQKTVDAEIARIRSETEEAVGIPREE